MAQIEEIVKAKFAEEVRKNMPEEFPGLKKEINAAIKNYLATKEAKEIIEKAVREEFSEFASDEISNLLQDDEYLWVWKQALSAILKRK